MQVKEEELNAAGCCMVRKDYQVNGGKGELGRGGCGDWG